VRCILAYRRRLRECGPISHPIMSRYHTHEKGLTRGFLRFRHVQFAQSEITERNVPGIVQQDILGFQVAIDNIEPVKMFQRAKQLRGIEPAPVLIKLSFPLQMVEQLSAVHKAHHEVQFVRGLEGEFEGDNEWIVHQSENCPLGEDVGNLSGSGGDVGLSDRLEGVYPLSVFFPYLHYLSERTLADHFEEIEGLDRERHFPGWLEIDLEVEGT